MGFFSSITDALGMTNAKRDRELKRQQDRMERAQQQQRIIDQQAEAKKVTEFEDNPILADIDSDTNTTRRKKAATSATTSGLGIQF
jgi:hypothetical protein